MESSYILMGECPRGTHVRYVLACNRVVIGRRGDVALCEASVSRKHAIMTRTGDSWKISDLGSRNGTFVNGVSVQRKTVFPGDFIKFGKVTLRLLDRNADESVDDVETKTMTRDFGIHTSTSCSLALIGRSEALCTAIRMAVKTARSNATVLLFGESGTGKELFAKLIWEESDRSDKKFLPVHSGAIEPSLLSSTLFGYEKGAFTGADRQHKGVFEEADGGTIFLDEIGEINAEAQLKLLRVLQEGEFMRVGGTTPVKVDVRMICATNRDLEEAVREGKFREDLYYRLNVIQINLPPLRERRGDIADLVNHFVNLLGGAVRSVSRDAMEVLCRYSWPGNVRQLRNVIERLVIMSDHDVINVEDLPAELREERFRGEGRPTTDSGTVTLSLADVENRHLMSVLRDCGGNKSCAARMLGISRSTLYEKLKGLGGEGE